MIDLPEGWTQEPDSLGAIVITGLDAHGRPGYITVDERRRNYALGMSQVTRAGSYAGRNWKRQLYADAVASLKAALGPF